MKLPTITLARKSGWEKLAKNLKAVGGAASYVGVPASKASRKKEKINNAELLFILSKGSPAHHLPATPWIEPALAATGNREIIADELRASAKARLAGDATNARQHLRRAGMAGQNAARSWPTDPRNGWPKLAPRTVQGRLRRMGKKAGKDTRKQLAEYEKGNADYPFTRNVDTGALRNAIIHVEREE